jgi:hypothetical protein
MIGADTVPLGMSDICAQQQDWLVLRGDDRSPHFMRHVLPPHVAPDRMESLAFVVDASHRICSIVLSSDGT